MCAIFKEIEELIGREKAVVLIERFGGISLYIPKTPTPRTPLVLALGHALGTEICDRFPASTVEIPSRLSLDQSRRRAAVLRDIDSGRPHSKIARTHGITARRVRQIASEHNS